jgi:hypothetical protein
MPPRTSLYPIALAALLFSVPALAAQGRPVRFSPDSAATGIDVEAATARRVGVAELDGFPADSIEALLLAQPGITPAIGGLSVRGGSPDDYAVFLNGVEISPASRRVRMSPALNGIGSMTAVTGPLPAALGGSRSGAILLESRVPSFGRHATLSYASDRFVGPSLGLNRLEGELSGASRRSRVFIGATLTGQKAVEPGAGARDVPIFVPAGIDTVVTVPESPGVPGSDISLVPVFNYAAARGECDRFAVSASADIAANYGLDCTGDRTPGSATSGYRFLATADHEVGRASRLMVTTHRARESQRLFSYPDLFNRRALFGRETAARAHSLVITGALDPRRGSGYRLGLSRQSDELTVGPLTAEGEASTWDPAGGFMPGGLDFLWDSETFPVDSALVANYRANRPSSRRSPYVLEAPAQYATADVYRDGPYGLAGFNERGGPVGRLTLFREQRTVAFATGSWTVSQNAVFTAGAEYARYDIASYDHALTSQARSDVYRVRPIRGALFAEDRIEYGPLTFFGGVRFAFFSSRADRPELLDTARFLPGGSPNPGFGTYQPFPRVSSYGNDGAQHEVAGELLPLVRLVRDRRHSVWTPHFRAAFAIGESATLRASLSRRARMPDLALIYAGMNTDLAITSTDQTFGTDLGFERASASELGFRQGIGAATSIDVAAFRTSASRVPEADTEPARDPLRNVTVPLRRIGGTMLERARGAELLVEHRGSSITASLGYTMLRARAGDEVAEWERPHTLTAVLGYAAPANVRRGIMRGATLWISFRVASGLPYAPCSGAARSDETCPGVVPPRSGRTPAFRQVDARFGRRIGGRRGNAWLYVDVRNLFNRRNLLTVFRETGTSEHTGARGVAIADAHVELAADAAANGVLRSDGSVDVSFGGLAASGCANWIEASGAPAAPDCVSLVRAEQRFGDGNGVYSAAEQAAAAGARFDALSGGFYGAPRRIRIGVEIGL